MSDSYKGCWVAFSADMKDEEAKATIDAIRQLRHVQGVDPSVTDHSDWMAREHIKAKVREDLLKLYQSI